MLTPLLFHFQPLSVSVRQKLYFPWIFQMSFSSYVTMMCAHAVLSFRHSSHCPFQWGWGSNLPVDGQQGCWGKQTLLSAAWPSECTHKHTHTHTHVHIHVHHSPYIYVIYTKVKRMEGWYMVYLQSVHIAELMSEVYSKLEFNHCWKVDKLHGFVWAMWPVCHNILKAWTTYVVLSTEALFVGRLDVQSLAQKCCVWLDKLCSP